MRIFAKTDVGIRRENNQDAFDAGVFYGGNGWAVVCDGMGGVNGGQVASSMCVSEVSQAIKDGYNSDMTVNDAMMLLRSAISAANTKVFERSVSEHELNGMGTTVVAVIVLDGLAVIAHVGDSRAYTVDLAEDKIIPLTKDHSLVQFFVDSGRITEEMAKVHPDRNIITRAVGIENFVDVDINIADVSNDKLLLIGTDGLNGYVDDDEILKVIKNNVDDSADNLVDTANMAGGHDNVTVVVLGADIQGE